MVERLEANVDFEQLLATVTEGKYLNDIIMEILKLNPFIPGYGNSTTLPIIILTFIVWQSSSQISKYINT